MSCTRTFTHSDPCLATNPCGRTSLCETQTVPEPPPQSTLRGDGHKNRVTPAEPAQLREEGATDSAEEARRTAENRSCGGSLTVKLKCTLANKPPWERMRARDSVRRGNTCAQTVPPASNNVCRVSSCVETRFCCSIHQRCRQLFCHDGLPFGSDHQQIHPTGPVGRWPWPTPGGPNLPNDNGRTVTSHDSAGILHSGRGCKLVRRDTVCNKLRLRRIRATTIIIEDHGLSDQHQSVVHNLPT